MFWMYHTAYTMTEDPFIASITEGAIMKRLHSWEYKLMAIKDLRKLQDKADKYDVIQAVVKENK